MPVDPRFTQPRYTIRRKVLKLAGGAFTVFDQSGATVLFAEQKAFRLKEDIRLFSGPDMSTELLRIAARRAIDISAAYDVFDSSAGDERVGALQRRGMKSMVQDEWWILDTGDRQIGTIAEESMALALVRRFVFNLIPQTYVVSLDGRQVAELKQHVNPFVYKIDLDFGRDPEGTLDRRLGLAAGILLAATERRQQ